MQVKYMQYHNDQEFLGVISGVTEWGIYVEIIENKCEGMVRIRDIKDDYYTFDEKQYALVGATTKALLQLGDEIYVKVKNADLAMSQVLEMFAPPTPIFNTEIHPSASIDATAVIGKGTRISAGCYVGPNVVLGENVTLYSNVTILDECTIGNNTIIWPGAVIRERCHLGTDCIIHPNATIGADGFGFRPCPERGLVKIPQIGNVIIGNWVEIGANSCVDRGKFSSTIVGDGCKIDNLVQIGHNSVLGRFCIMAGNSGLAGSVTLGDGVIIGGSASIKDHTTIGSGAIVGAGSGVTGDIEAGKTMLGYPAVEAREALKQWAILKRLVRDSGK
jgi:UDP-3-O-[3-hydroxymyristoyl] glucosamine N-acyltransferase